MPCKVTGVIVIKKQKCSTFYRILLSYLLVFFIPFSLLSSFIYYYYRDTNNRLILTESARSLSYTMEDIQSWQSTFQNVVNQLQYDNEIMSNYSPKSYSSVTSLLNKLKIFTTTRESLAYIWYYCEDDDYIFAGRDSCTVDRFNNTRFTTSDTSIESGSLLEELQTGKSLLLWDKYLHNNYYLFPYTIIRNGGKRHLVVFQVLDKAFTNPLSRLLDGRDGLVALLSDDGSTIASYSQGDASGYNQALCDGRTVIENKDITVQGDLLNLSGKRKICLTCVSNKSAWSLQTIITETSTHSFGLLEFLLVVVFIALILGLVLVLFTSKFSYAPIHSIMSKTSSLLSSDSKQVKNDYEYIENCIDLMDYERSQMKSSLDHHIAAMRGMMIRQLLGGQFDSIESFNSEAENLNISLRYSNFLVAITLCDSNIDQGLFGKNGTSNESIQMLTLPLSMCDGFIAIISFPETEDETFEKSVIEQMRQKTQAVCSIGMSAPCKSPREIPAAYAQAVLALSNTVVGSGAATCKYPPETDIRYASVSIRKLKQALDQNNYTEVAESLNNLKTEILNHRGLIQETLTITYQAVYLILTYFKTLSIDAAVLENPLSLFIHQKLKASELIAIIDNLVYTVSQQNNPADKINFPIEQMKIYIEQHYTDTNFSIKNLASFFSMPVSSLSNYFKQMSGQQLIDVITELKINKAKDLLAHSSKSIQEVGIAVGYFNTTSFIRRFRQITGITPGEYRRSFCSGYLG
ncbi:MAG: helix-turn-helix domain-containing protein [Clostridiaceae bacterium]|nr:helix-turn-helix domain-containing protein [Clostridiaceae bacterium]